MKKLVVVLRFGSSTPVRSDMVVGERLVEGRLDRAAGVSFPMGFASVFLTRFTPAEIGKIYQEVAEELGDTLPVQVFYVDDPNVHVDLLTPGYDGMIKAAKQEWLGDGAGPDPVEHVDLTLDQLLDKIHRVGVDGLSPAEMARLKSLT